MGVTLKQGSGAEALGDAWGCGYYGAGLGQQSRTGRGQTVPGVRVTLPKALGKRVAGDFQLGDLQRRK